MKHICFLFNEDFSQNNEDSFHLYEAFLKYSRENLIHSIPSTSSSFSFSNFPIADKKTFSVNEKWENAAHIILLYQGQRGEEEKDRVESACLLNHLTIFADSRDADDLNEWLERSIPSSIIQDIHFLSAENLTYSNANEKGEKRKKEKEIKKEIKKELKITVTDSSFPLKFKTKKVLEFLGEDLDYIAVDLNAKRNYDRHTIDLLKRDLDDLKRVKVSCVFGAFADMNATQVNVHDPVKNANFVAHFKTALSHASALGAPVLIYGVDDAESESRRVSSTRECEYLSYRRAHDGFLKTMTHLSEFAAALDPPVQVVIGPAGNYLFAHEDVLAMVDLIGHPNCHCLVPSVSAKKTNNPILLKINELFPVDTLSLSSFKSLFGFLRRFVLLQHSRLISSVCDHDPSHNGNGDGDQGGDDEVDGDIAAGKRG
jgi:hypothetical protein